MAAITLMMLTREFPGGSDRDEDVAYKARFRVGGFKPGERTYREFEVVVSKEAFDELTVQLDLENTEDP